MKKLGLLIFIFYFVGILNAQIVLNGLNDYTQDFNTLASTTTSSVVPTGWFFSESGTNANTTYNVSFGSSNEGNTYSFGAVSNTERAFGGLLSGSLVPTIGAQFQNNTGSPITQLPIQYTGEQWRLGATARVDRLDFQYSLNATSLTTGTWIDVDQLDFIAPVTAGTVGALDGNSAPNRTGIQYMITGLNIANGSTFWIRWTDFNATGADDGLAIDDFSLDNLLPVELTSFSAAVIGKDVKLSWNTATEINNFGFEIERKVGSSQSSVGNYEKIGFINGNGNSNSPKSYSFVDDKVSTGKYFYRLKQIDNDGQYEYSKTIEVDVNGVKEYKLTQNYPNPFNPATTIQYILPQAGMVKLTLYNILGQEIRTLVNEIKEAGTHTINIDASDLNSGMYIYKIESGSFVQTRKMTLVK
jgi:hypothetical protein